MLAFVADVLFAAGSVTPVWPAAFAVFVTTGPVVSAAVALDASAAVKAEDAVAAEACCWALKAAACCFRSAFQALRLA